MQARRKKNLTQKSLNKKKNESIEAEKSKENIYAKKVSDEVKIKQYKIQQNVQKEVKCVRVWVKCDCKTKC